MTRGSAGASLVGLLLIVVVLGALTATAVVAVSTLNSGDNKSVISQTIGRGTVGTGPAGGSGVASANPTSANPASAENACRASADAARAASAVFYANSGGSYPVKWSDLTASNPPMFALANNVAINGANPKELDGRGWKLTLSGGGTGEPTFTCA